ncbi:MAG TPA: AraC family transcriptional regulator [Puia sp.]|nr:AraC family transcriptional regulator [Puia sp.]
MPVKSYLDKVELTHPKLLHSVVENRRVFNLENCELNIYESYKAVYNVPLTFNDFAITSMVRGKKIMHMGEKPAFDYLPGESMVIAPNEPMIIDFPDASHENPTQCIALTVDADYIEDTIDYLNNYYNGYDDSKHDWKLQFNQYHFYNNADIAELMSRIVRISSGPNLQKNIFVDLNLKELLIRLIQSQFLKQVLIENTDISNRSRQHYVLKYIQDHLTEKIAVNTLSRKAYLSRNVFFKWFREQFGISPLEYINSERIKIAKRLLADPRNSIKDVSLQCGFSDTNYFVRIFKKTEGITPGSYQSICREQPDFNMDP